jgi:hypothetical protein
MSIAKEEKKLTAETQRPQRKKRLRKDFKVLRSLRGTRDFIFLCVFSAVEI